MAPEIFRMMGSGPEVNALRRCSMCEHRHKSQFLGMRCLHPKAKSTEPIYGLPPTCLDVRGNPFQCGPGGDWHSSVQGSTAAPQ